jgi:hypothetical protein
MPRIPSLRHHKPSGRAVVTIAGTDIEPSTENAIRESRPRMRAKASPLSGPH